MRPLLLELASRTRVSLIWWIVGTLALCAYVVAIYDTIGSLDELSRLYESYPPAIRKIIGEVDIGTLNGWIQVEFMSWFPLILAIYAGIFAAGNISKEAEQRTLDFVLALPVTRRQFIASRLIVGLGNMLVICLIAFLLLVTEVAIVGHSPSAGRYALALANAFLLGAALLAAYVLIASFVDEQARVTGISIGSTIVLYVATAALKAADAPAPLRWLMPFEHYHAAEAMMGDGLPVLPVILLISAACIATVMSLYWYSRRDIT